MTSPSNTAPGRSPFAPFLAACTFLTRLPLPGAAAVDEDSLARSSVWFPVVGAVVGAFGALTLIGAGRLWPPFVAATLSVLATVLLTGAFHEDALADSADGFGGGWTRERVLEIMSDSRIGAYGVVALVLVLSARIGCLAAMAPMDGARALIGAHVLARWSSLPLIRVLPYARPEGSGNPFVGSVTGARLFSGTLLAVLLASMALGRRVLPAALAAAVVTAVAGRYFRARLGGITGDCLGATNQIVELVTYLTVLA
jgi:adenosylcobinamide-GDP ribazoletransferase